MFPSGSLRALPPSVLYINKKSAVGLSRIFHEKSQTAFLKENDKGIVQCTYNNVDVIKSNTLELFFAARTERLENVV